TTKHNGLGSLQFDQMARCRIKNIALRLRRDARRGHADIGLMDAIEVPLARHDYRCLRQAAVKPGFHDGSRAENAGALCASRCHNPVDFGNHVYNRQHRERLKCVSAKMTSGRGYRYETRTSSGETMSKAGKDLRLCRRIVTCEVVDQRRRIRVN